MKKIIYIFIPLIVLINNKAKAQQQQYGILDRGNYYPKTNIRTVCKDWDLKGFCPSIVDSFSVDENSQSLNSYFIMDSLIDNIDNIGPRWRTETLNFISLSEIVKQLASDTVLNGKKNFVDIIKPLDFVDALRYSKLELYFLNRNTGFLFGSCKQCSSLNTFYLFRTEDGGKHWMNVNPFPKKMLEWYPHNLHREEFHMFDEQKGIIVPKPDIYSRFGSRNICYSYTKDRGKTWFNNEIKTKYSLLNLELSCSPTGQVILMVKYKIDNEDFESPVLFEIYQSKNYGETFKKLK